MAPQRVTGGVLDKKTGGLTMAELGTIGFIGLGIMGSPMASNLVGAGFDVVVYNRSVERTELLVQRGARAARDIRSVAEMSDLVITMLPDSPDVEAVWLADDGLVSHTRPGALLIDMSTVRPQLARHLANEASQRGLAALDAPVSGGEQGAVSGTLSIMVGGEQDGYERSLPVLRTVGSTITRVGPAGAGQTVKAANQLIVAGALGLLAEAIVLLQASDIDTEAALKVLQGGLAGSVVMERKAGAMLSRQFDPGFRLRLHHKDLGIMQETSRQVGVVLPLGSIAAQLVASAVAQGWGDCDHAAILNVVERLAGLGQ